MKILNQSHKSFGVSSFLLIVFFTYLWQYFLASCLHAHRLFSFSLIKPVGDSHGITPFQPFYLAYLFLFSCFAFNFSYVSFTWVFKSCLSVSSCGLPRSLKNIYFVLLISRFLLFFGGESLLEHLFYLLGTCFCGLPLFLLLCIAGYTA